MSVLQTGVAHVSTINSRCARTKRSTLDPAPLGSRNASTKNPSKRRLAASVGGLFRGPFRRKWHARPSPFGWAAPRPTEPQAGPGRGVLGFEEGRRLGCSAVASKRRGPLIKVYSRLKTEIRNTCVSTPPDHRNGARERRRVRALFGIEPHPRRSRLWRSPSVVSAGVGFMRIQPGNIAETPRC
jgi:hypothetical protein